MKQLLLLLCCGALLTACSNNNKKQTTVPVAVASAEAARTALQGRHFTVADVGFQRSFMDKKEPVEWSEAITDTGKIFRSFMEDRKNFSLRFVNDSAVALTDATTKTDALWSVTKDSTAGMLLQLQYVDPEFSFPGQEGARVTYTYKLLGVDDQQLYLETPREYNRSQVVLLMKRQN